MKLKFIAGLLIAGASLFAACQPTLTPVKSGDLVESSFVVLPTEGGTASVAIKYNGEWTLEAVAEYDWLTISETSGNGPKTVEFTAAKGSSERNALFELICGDKNQIISVKQLGTVTEATCKDVIDGADGAVYRVTGFVTSIANTQYGNWYLKDDTGEVYVYGTLDKNGAEKNFSSLNVEVGDQLTVEGPKTTYNGTVELVNVSVVKHEKAILKLVTPASYDIPVEGQEILVNIVNKGEGLEFSIPDDAASWINLVSSSKKDVLADSFDPNSAVVAIDNTFKFVVAPIEEGMRSAEINFRTTIKTGVDKTTGEPKHSVYNTTIVVNQVAITTATAAEINAADDGKKFKVTGLVANVAANEYGNYDIVDHTGKIYVYGTLDKDGKTKNFSSLGIKEGDIVTVTGPKTSYNNAAQMKNVTVEKHISVSKVTVADFLTKETNKEVYYMLTGTVNNYKPSDLYGNFDLVDETGSVYVYGVLKGWGGAKKLFPELGVQNGDKITIVATKDFYAAKSQHQAANAFYVKHEAGTPAGGDDEGEVTTVEVSMDVLGTEDFTLEDGKTYEVQGMNILFNKKNSSNSNYNSGDKGVRFYQDDKLTFSIPGKTLVGLEFTAYGGKEGPISANVGTIDGLKWTGSAASVEITATKQLRFNKIKVSFK